VILLLIIFSRQKWSLALKINNNEESKSFNKSIDSSVTEDEAEDFTIDHFTFYKDVLTSLQNRSLDDIKPSKNLPILAPLFSMNKDESIFNNPKIKLYKVTCIGFDTAKSIKIEIIDREITKSFDLVANSKFENVHQNENVSAIMIITLIIDAGKRR